MFSPDETAIVSATGLYVFGSNVEKSAGFLGVTGAETVSSTLGVSTTATSSFAASTFVFSTTFATDSVAFSTVSVPLTSVDSADVSPWQASNKLVNSIKLALLALLVKALECFLLSTFIVFLYDFID